MARIVHFEIQVKDPQASMDFYGKLFGWKFKRFGEMPYWLIETGPDGQPGINGGLLPRNSGPPVEGAAVNAFVCTAQVDSLDETFAKALANGGTSAVPKMPITGVGWLAYIKDPDGNIFGMMQPDTGAA
jgi:predicted enzyme related to lactoylglutathione lyase